MCRHLETERSSLVASLAEESGRIRDDETYEPQPQFKLNLTATARRLEVLTANRACHAKDGGQVLKDVLIWAGVDARTFAASKDCSQRAQRRGAKWLMLPGGLRVRAPRSASWAQSKSNLWEMEERGE